MPLLLFPAAAGGCLLLALVFTVLAIRVAPRVGYVDRPGGHKTHATPTPYGGGVAIFLASWLPLGIVLALAVTLSQAWVADVLGEQMRAYVGGLRARAPGALIIISGGLVLFMLGLLDDLRPLPAVVKLTVIIAAGLLVPLGAGVRVVEFAGPAVSVALTATWIVVVTNTFNFLDNMDGLSAGVACICTLFFVICGLMSGQVLVPAMGCVFLGAVHDYV